MAGYQIAYNFEVHFGQGETWLIERVIAGEAPCRLYFRGTRKEAQAEVTRLNALLRLKAQ